MLILFPFFLLQYRGAQETLLYKDEQLREAQAWIARVQEMDALQSQSLQSELRERTEQCNQLWLGWQRQVSTTSFTLEGCIFECGHLCILACIFCSRFIISVIFFDAVYLSANSVVCYKC